MSEQIYNEIEKILYLAIENEISKEQIQTLNGLLADQPDRIRFAVNYLQVYSFLRQSNKVANMSKDEWFVDGFDIDRNMPENEAGGSKLGADSNVSVRGVDIEEFMCDENLDSEEDRNLTVSMLELLEMERTAPVVEIEKPAPSKPKRELIQKVDSNFKLFPGKGNKALTFAYLALAACIMLFVGYVYFFVPDPLDRPVVAKLDDSINAVWDDKLQIPGGFDEMVQSKYRLKKGFASILFNDGAKVTVEAPAEFSLNSSGDMELFSGRIYASVPQHAHGFTVKAGDSKIVDLGTEFGVEIDSNENAQLHVTKGRTMLFAGLDEDSKPQVEVDAGAARKVYNDGFIKDIPLVNEKFVRMIDSKAGVVWNGISNIGLSGDGLVFSESFENPVVEGYLEDSVPEANWVGSKEGYCADNRGLFHEGKGEVFTTAYGNQAFLLDYTNAGLVTSETAIREVLTAGTTYAVTFNAAHTPIVSPPKIDEVHDEVIFKKNLLKTDSSTYRVELVAYDPGDYRGDVRHSRELRPGTILAFAEGSVTSNDMTAGDSIFFTVKDGDPNLSKNIAIRLVKSSGSVLYDNIKLRVWKSKDKSSY